MKLPEYLRARACEKGEQDVWATSRHFRDDFKEIKSRNSIRKILRRCEDIKRIKDPCDKRRYKYGLLERPEPTKEPTAAYV